jgi:hypothetical protein
MSEQWVKNPPQPAVCYELNRTQDHGYYHFEIYVFQAERQNVNSLLAGTVDNKAGYGTSEAAAKLGRMYQSLIDAGYLSIYETGWRDRPYFRIRWLEYEPSYNGSDPRHRGYCEHKIETLGNGTIEGIKTSLDLVDELLKSIRKDPKVGKQRENVQLDDPKSVIAGLEKMGANRVQRASGFADAPTFYVDAKDRRPRLRSEGILSMFGA